MDKEKAEAYKIVGDIFCKVFLVLVIGLGWSVMVGYLVFNPLSVGLGIGVANVPILMTAIIQHFFPKRR